MISLHLRAGAGQPFPAIALLMLILGLGQPHVAVHVNDRHHFAGARQRVRAGPVKGEPEMEADLAEIERCLVDGQVRQLELIVDFLLAGIADFKDPGRF